MFRRPLTLNALFRHSRKLAEEEGAGERRCGSRGSFDPFNYNNQNSFPMLSPPNDRTRSWTSASCDELAG